MHLPKIFLIPILLCVTLPSATFAEEDSSKTQAMIDYKVTPNVTYGQGVVTKNGNKVTRNLWMDVYEPVEQAQQPRPAVIMTFGGAFHRGNPRETFADSGAQDTSMGGYCRKFASRGYICFAINYRLTPEGPVPSMEGYSVNDLDLGRMDILIDQVNHVRNQMSLQTLDLNDPDEAKLLSDAVLSAAEDLRSALHHIRANSKKYGVDTTRIVLGGFSAGAITTLNVAHGMQSPIAGAFLLSGTDVGFDIKKITQASKTSTPILMFGGQNDLPGLHVSAPDLIKHYEKIGVEYDYAWVAGFGHFYPAGAVSLGIDGSRKSVEERISLFLQETVGRP